MQKKHSHHVLGEYAALGSVGLASVSNFSPRTPYVLRSAGCPMGLSPKPHQAVLHACGESWALYARQRIRPVPGLNNFMPKTVGASIHYVYIYIYYDTLQYEYSYVCVYVFVATMHATSSAYKNGICIITKMKYNICIIKQEQQE